MSFSRSPARVTRVAAVGAGVLLLVSTAAAAAVGSRLHDPDLDLADAAVEKAEGLLQLTSCDLPNEKNAKECEKAVAKALADLADARNEIAAAVAASDGVVASSPTR